MAQKELSSERIRVLISHKVRLLKEGLVSLLLKSPRLTVIELSPQEPVHKEQQERNAVDIVIAVSEWVTNTATDQIKEIKNTFPNAKVVIIGVFGTENESLECIEAGASGYILPESCLEHLIETIQMVHRGEASCPPDILARLFERVASLRMQLQTVNYNDLSSLTQRELEVLQFVSDGMSNKEISAHLGVELKTVKNHVHRILEKLQVHNRREAVACTRKYGLVIGND